MKVTYIISSNPRESQHRALKEAGAQPVAFCYNFNGNINDTARCIQFDTRVLIIEDVYLPEHEAAIDKLIRITQYDMLDANGKRLYTRYSPNLIICTSSRTIPLNLINKETTIIDLTSSNK